MSAPMQCEATASASGASPHRLVRLVILAGAPLAVAGAAWVVAGTAFWQALAFWGGVAAVVNLVRGLVRRLPASSQGMGLYYLGVWLAWYLIGAQFALGYVYVDNFTPHQVGILLDGRNWVALDRNGTSECRLRQGTYHVTVQSLPDGQNLDEMEITIESQYGLLTSCTNNYVLNVLGMGHYRQGSQVYSDRPEMWSSAAESRIQKKWFKVEADYIFEEPPTFGRAGSTATYLRRDASPRE